jgi:hypothetical protein
MTSNQIRDIESNQQVKTVSFDWETENYTPPVATDDDHLENMRALGLLD